MTRKRWTTALVLIGLFVVPVRMASASAIRMGTAQLAAAAEEILLATVEKIVQPDPNRYVLEVHLRVEETLKGNPHNGPFILRLRGGVVNGRGLFSSETPRFEVGGRVIVYLQSQTFPGAPVVGGRQGCLHVRNGRVAEKGVSLTENLGNVRAKVAEQKSRRIETGEGSAK